MTLVMFRLLISSAVVVSISATTAHGQEMAGDIDLSRAHRYFSEFDGLCASDDGKLWGMSFCGPILLVDPPRVRSPATGAMETACFSPAAKSSWERCP